MLNRINANVVIINLIEVRRERGREMKSGLHLIVLDSLSMRQACAKTRKRKATNKKKRIITRGREYSRMAANECERLRTAAFVIRPRGRAM